MIIFLIGTSGSGKSTIARLVMRRYESKVPIVQSGRRQPLGYVLKKKGCTSLLVPGHYETQCGGADTIHSADELFDLIRDYSENDFNVLVEGVLLYSMPKRMILLKDNDHPVITVGLTKVPLEECAASVEARREMKAMATGRPQKESGPNFMANLTAKHRGTVNCLDRLAGAGVHVAHCDRDSALSFILDHLGVAS